TTRIAQARGDQNPKGARKGTCGTSVPRQSHHIVRRVAGSYGVGKNVSTNAPAAAARRFTDRSSATGIARKQRNVACGKLPGRDGNSRILRKLNEARGVPDRRLLLQQAIDLPRKLCRLLLGF